jgi:nucleoid-associated protein YgaU
MNFLELKKKYFNSTEEVVSMFLGLVIVVVVGGLIFNYFQKNKGSVSIPGTTDISLNEDLKINKTAESTYEVVKGDSLWKIAQNKYNNGYAWTEIAKANNLKNPSSIEIGQKIILPKIETKEIITKSVEKINNEIAQGGDYKVVKNDSLWKIAVRSYGDGYQWTKIWQTNKSKLINPGKLEIGMFLTIPKLN